MVSRSRLTARLALAFAAAWAAPASAAEFLPDIDMHAPADVISTTEGPRSFVAFRSSVTNVGPGVLKVAGLRQKPSDTKMAAKQLLLDMPSVQTGRVAREIPNVGQMEFSPSVDHMHWHFLHFEDYQLLSVPGLDFVAPTRKTGFCLSGLDSYWYCAGNQPGVNELGWYEDPFATHALSQAQGLVVANGPDVPGPQNRRSADDDYGPTVEGQDIEITDVAAARYCLSFVVNPQDKLVEADYANNGASRLIDVRGTPGGGRTVTLPPNSAQTPTVFESSGTCGLTKPVPTLVDPGTEGGGGGTTTSAGDVTTAPGGGGATDPRDPPPRPPAALTKSQAARLSTIALKQKLGNPRSITGSCKLGGANKATCHVTLKQSGAPYKGTVTIIQKLQAGESRWFHKIDVKRTRKTACAAARRSTCPARVKTETLLGGVLGANPVAAKRALRAPAGPAALSRPGTAWPQAWLPPASRARVQAYKSLAP